MRAPFVARSKIIVDSRSRRNVCLALKSFIRLGLDGGQQLIAPQNTVKFQNKPQRLYFLKALFEGLIFGGAYIRRSLSMEGNLRFKIDWGSLTVGSKFTFFALFYFVFEGNFQVQAPGGLIFGGTI